MSGSFWLAEEQFNKIKPLLPNKPRGMPRVDDRKALSGIVFCLLRGYRWSDVPPEYGPAKTLYNRYKRWAEAGFLSRYSRLWHRKTPISAGSCWMQPMSKPTGLPRTG